MEKLRGRPRTRTPLLPSKLFQSRSNISIDGLIGPGSQTWQALLQAAGNQTQAAETRPALAMSAALPSSNSRLRRSLGKSRGQFSSGLQTVQRLLQTAAQKLQAPQLDPKGVDGKIARPPGKSNTVAAIEGFQSRSNISIDGLIGPGSQTWQALLQAAGGS